MDKTDFQIFSIPNSADEIPPIVAEGRNNGQFRYPPYDWMKEYPAQERDFHPDYSRAAMSDSKLCISCVQNCIDIHETLTGRCLGSFQLPKALHCWTLVLAPDEKTLAVGTVHGEVLLYNLETVGKATAPVTIPAKVDGKSVSCIAFSAESRYISICNSANNIYTYLLLNDAEPSLISQYSRGLAETACRDPYYGVTSLSLWLSLVNVC
jgi:WD40 repeat protein